MEEMCVETLFWLCRNSTRLRKDRRNSFVIGIPKAFDTWLCSSLSPRRVQSSSQSLVSEHVRNSKIECNSVEILFNQSQVSR